MNYWTHPSRALQVATTFAAITFGMGLQDWRKQGPAQTLDDLPGRASSHARWLTALTVLREALIGLPRFEQREMGQLIAEQLKAKMKIDI